MSASSFERDHAPGTVSSVPGRVLALAKRNKATTAIISGILLYLTAAAWTGYHAQQEDPGICRTTAVATGYDRKPHDLAELANPGASERELGAVVARLLADGAQLDQAGVVQAAPGQTTVQVGQVGTCAPGQHS